VIYLLFSQTKTPKSGFGEAKKESAVIPLWLIIKLGHKKVYFTEEGNFLETRLVWV